MERLILNTLIVNDDDLDCDCKETTLENMTIANVGFRLPDIERFDMVIYKGKRGQKILRSRYTGLGKIE
jgi:hypothetical protein